MMTPVARSAALPLESPSSSADGSPGAFASRKRVLVVDDNEDSAWPLSQLLREEGHEVEMTLDGPSALDLLARLLPDAALLDINLPGMDGLALARELRVRVPGILLVAVTGHDRDADREASRLAGFDAHLVKPVDVGDVTRLLDARPARA
jgi:CheY-like chemotaxis protein